MRFIRVATLCALLTLQAFHVLAQEPDRYLGYGVKAGMNYSTIYGLETTILSEPYFLNYVLFTQPTRGLTAGMFINYRMQNQVLGIQTEVMYSKQGSDLIFNNLERDFNYRMQFNYEYINVSGTFKVYPWRQSKTWNGLNIAAGPQFGFNVASNNIIYTSGGSGRLTAFGTDLEQQQQIRNVLKGKNNLGFNFGLGYEFYKFGLTFDARYYVGVSDVVETLPNNYNFIENKNVNKMFQVTLGWDLAYFQND